MKLLIYRSTDHDWSEKLQDDLELISTVEKIDIYDSMTDLKMGLRHPGENTEIGILIISDVKEIGELQKIKSLLNKLRIIMVLPSYRDDYLKPAYKLGPRFITYVDSDLSEMRDVVERLASR